MDPITITVLVVVGICAVMAFFWLLELLSPLLEIVFALGVLILLISWFRNPAGTEQEVMYYLNSLVDFAHHVRDLAKR